MKIKTNSGWIAKITIASMLISMALTFASAKILGSAGYVMAFLVLAVFILLGVVFDTIGVAVTAASIAPFHSMAAKKESGAAEALRLIRNAEKVSSICADVVGDISGIISGTTSALIVHKADDGPVDGEYPDTARRFGVGYRGDGGGKGVREDIGDRKQHQDRPGRGEAHPPEKQSIS